MQRMNPWMLLITAVFSSIAIWFSREGTEFVAIGIFVLFNLVTLHLLQLQKENDELRTRLEALEGHAPATELPENRAVAHG